MDDSPFPKVFRERLHKCFTVNECTLQSLKLSFQRWKFEQNPSIFGFTMAFQSWTTFSSFFFWWSYSTSEEMDYSIIYMGTLVFLVIRHFFQFVALLGHPFLFSRTPWPFTITFCCLNGIITKTFQILKKNQPVI